MKALARKILIACFAITAVGIAPNFALGWTTVRSFNAGPTNAVANGVPDGFSEAGAATLYSGDVVREGQFSGKLQIQIGTDGWGKWGGVVNFPTQLAKGDQIWIALDMFYPEGFDLTTNTGMLKFIRLRNVTGAGTHVGYLDNLIRNPASQLGVYTVYKEDQELLVHYGARGKDDIKLGQWIRYEFYAFLDDVPKASGGRSVVRAWVDGKLMLDTDKVRSISGPDHKVLSLFLYTYWNGGAPKSQAMYIDNLTITTDMPTNRDAAGNPMIGIVGMPPPSAPALQIQ